MLPDLKSLKDCIPQVWKCSCVITGALAYVVDVQSHHRAASVGFACTT